MSRLGWTERLRPSVEPVEAPPPRVQVIQVAELADNALEDDAGATTAAESRPAPEEPPAATQSTGAPATSTPATTRADAAARETYDEALATYHERNYVQAELAFLRFFEAFPATDLSDNALYWIGESRFARGDDRGAMAAFQRLLHEFPLGNKVPDALVKIGRTLERLGDIEGAERRFREVKTRFPGTASAATAEAALALLQERD